MLDQSDIIKLFTTEVEWHIIWSVSRCSCFVILFLKHQKNNVPHQFIQCRYFLGYQHFTTANIRIQCKRKKGQPGLLCKSWTFMMAKDRGTAIKLFLLKYSEEISYKSIQYVSAWQTIHTEYNCTKKHTKYWYLY